jgi:hypothetical protein
MEELLAVAELLESQMREVEAVVPEGVGQVPALEQLVVAGTDQFLH